MRIKYHVPIIALLPLTLFSFKSTNVSGPNTFLDNATRISHQTPFKVNPDDDGDVIAHQKLTKSAESSIFTSQFVSTVSPAANNLALKDFVKANE